MGIKTKIREFYHRHGLVIDTIAIVGLFASLCGAYGYLIYKDDKLSKERFERDMHTLEAEHANRMKEIEAIKAAAVESNETESDTFDNPILGAPVSSRSQFEMARSLYKMMDPYENEKDILTDEMRQSCLELAWDLAAIEGKTNAAIDEGLLPTQVWD